MEPCWAPPGKEQSLAGTRKTRRAGSSRGERVGWAGGAKWAHQATAWGEGGGTKLWGPSFPNAPLVLAPEGGGPGLPFGEGRSQAHAVSHLPRSHGRTSARPDPGSLQRRRGKERLSHRILGKPGSPCADPGGPSEGRGSVLGSDLSGPPGRAMLMNILECVNTERSDNAPSPWQEVGQRLLLLPWRLLLQQSLASPSWGWILISQDKQPLARVPQSPAGTRRAAWLPAAGAQIVFSRPFHAEFILDV